MLFRTLIFHLFLQRNLTTLQFKPSSLIIFISLCHFFLWLGSTPMELPGKQKNLVFSCLWSYCNQQIGNLNEISWVSWQKSTKDNRTIESKMHSLQASSSEKYWKIYEIYLWEYCFIWREKYSSEVQWIKKK